MNKSKPKLLEKSPISVNRSRAIYGCFTFLDVLSLVISQWHFGNSGLFTGEQAMGFIHINVVVNLEFIEFLTYV